MEMAIEHRKRYRSKYSASPSEEETGHDGDEKRQRRSTSATANTTRERAEYKDETRGSYTCGSENNQVIIIYEMQIMQQQRSKDRDSMHGRALSNCQKKKKKKRDRDTER